MYDEDYVAWSSTPLDWDIEYYFWPSFIRYPDGIDSQTFSLGANAEETVTLFDQKIDERYPTNTEIFIYAAMVDAFSGDLLGEVERTMFQGNTRALN
jgi:hypothetical protein